MDMFVNVKFEDIIENEEYVKTIQKVINSCFKKEKLEQLNIYIDVTLTTPENIRKLNKEYRNIDKSTDVLSFPMFEKEEIEVKRANNENEVEDVLGDIIISVEQVKKQAEEYGHSFERELSYMVVHGFYHLMGYDHIDEKDKIIMRPKEEAILNELNICR